MTDAVIPVTELNTVHVEALAPSVTAEIDEWLTRYPDDQKQSAILAALRAAQHHNKGFLTVPIMNAIAEYLDMSKIAVYEVASFYSMFELAPVGEHNIAVCTNISCMLRGGYDILHHLEEKLGVKVGESTADGKFFLKKEEECLAACSGGPMMQVDHVYFEHLTTEKVDEIIDNIDSLVKHHD